MCNCHIMYYTTVSIGEKLYFYLFHGTIDFLKFIYYIIKNLTIKF